MKLRLPALTICLGAAAATATAGDLLAGRLYTEPARPYVNQPLTLYLELETTPGCQLQGISLSGLPGEDYLQLGDLVERPRRQHTRGGQSVTVHSYVSAGRGVAPLPAPLQPVVGMTLVERRASGFFTSMTSSPRTLRLPATTLTIRPLPEAGRPEGFAGAVGSFELRGALSPSAVMPRDLVTLTLQLTGQGYLGDAPLVLPAIPAGLFKAYPPREERLAAEARLTVSQVVIPLSTQAVQVAAAHFPYFEPVQGVYRTATAGPFALAFTTRRDEIAPVRQLPPPSDNGAAAVAPLRMDEARRVEVRRLLPWTLGLLAALLGAAAIRPYRPRWALATGVAIGALVFGGARLWLRGHTPVSATLRQAAVLRVAPGRRARAGIELPAGAKVQPLEATAGWVRVAAHGRRGWVPREALAAATNAPASSALAP